MNDHFHIHQRFSLLMGQRGAMVEMIRSRWAPHLERRHGVRLAGILGGGIYIWEEDWDGLAGDLAAQFPNVERDLALEQWWSRGAANR